MDLKIHTVGASGSGTTSLALALAKRLSLPHFDADDYYWKPTDPPFTLKRPPDQRVTLLEKDLKQHASWALSGSLVNWGDSLKHLFSHVIFIYLPQDIRIGRLKVREREKFGSRLDFGGDMHQQHLDFLEWARKYDHGGLEVRSRQLHENWFKSLRCPIIRISGELSSQDQVESVLTQISEAE